MMGKGKGCDRDYLFLLFLCPFPNYLLLLHLYLPRVAPMLSVACGALQTNKHYDERHSSRIGKTS